jgi:hypothetical protein
MKITEMVTNTEFRQEMVSELDRQFGIHQWTLHSGVTHAAVRVRGVLQGFINPERGPEKRQ